MRVKGILVLFVLIVLIIPPLAINISHSSNEAAIFTLDVCHASNQSLSTNLDLQCLFETPFNETKLEITNIQEEIKPILNLFLIAFQIEHPPKV